MNRTSALLALGLLAAPCQAQRPTSYVTMQSAFVFSAGYDLASTLYVMDRCPLCQETNPLVPVGRHRVALIAVSAGLTAGQVWLADRLWASERLHRYWWLVPVLGTVNHLLAAQLNLRLLQ